MSQKPPRQPTVPRPRRLRRRRTAFPLKSRGPITALDWDGEELRVAQSVQHGGKAELSHFAVTRLKGPIAVGKDDPAECGLRLGQALAELKLKPDLVVMGIARGLVFLRTLALPKPQTQEELASMVHFQLSKDLPFRAEEAVIDFQVNAAPPPPGPATEKSEAAGEATAAAGPAAEKVEVLVAVVKREVVEFYERLAEAAGLKLAALGLDACANARGLKLCGLAGQPRVVALVSLRSEEVITDVLVGEALAFSRTASLTRAVSETPTESQPAAETQETKTAPGVGGAGAREQITIEVVRSLHNFEGLERHERVEQIVVTGAVPETAPVVEALSQRCQRPCQQLEPQRALGVPASGASEAAGALTVLSLALMAQDGTAWPFDFLHPKRPALRRNVRHLRLLSAAAAAVVVLGTALGIRTHLMHQRIAARDRVAAEVELAAKNRQVYHQMRLKAKLVHDWTQEKEEWLDHYARLSALLPDCSEVYVTSISTGAKGMLHLSVRARSGDVLAQIDQRLRAAGYGLKPLAVTPSADRYGYSFQSSLELTLPDKKAQIALSDLKVPPRPPDDSSLEPGKAEAEAAVAKPVAVRDVTLPRPGKRNRP